MYQIKDNFLSPSEFEEVKDILEGDMISWYNNKETVKGRNQQVPLLTHTFFDINPPWDGPSSQYFPLMRAFVERLKIYPENLYRIKANLQFKTIFHRNTGYHYDDFPEGKIALFYVNTNNGYTKIKKVGKINCIANRLVIFDSSLEHAGFTCTDEDTRVVINFNYS